MTIHNASMSEFVGQDDHYGPDVDHSVQKKWRDESRFKTEVDPGREPYYELDMFPYPSGNGLHMGHVRGYVAGDVVSRYQTLRGKNVLHPMGWDAFGLPAEQYALAHGKHPDDITRQNIANFRTQLDSLGLSYDWDRELKTTDSDFMRWTQWAFLKMYEKGLVYESDEPISWCPSCKTGLSNEDLDGCNCERCGTAIEKKPIPQIKVRIKDYASKLIDGMKDLDGWDEEILAMQRNWIGLEDGYSVRTTIHSEEGDTEGTEVSLYVDDLAGLLGATRVIVAADSLTARNLAVDSSKNIQDKLAYYTNLPEAQRKQLHDTIALQQKVLNPVSGEYADVFIDPQLIADRVEAKFVTASDSEWSRLGSTEAMSREDIFKKYLIPDDVDDEDLEELVKFYLSALYLPVEKKQISNLQDWVFSRQRFWGEPIPLVHCEKDGIVPLPEESLPLALPEVDTYSLTDTGESPLVNMQEWVKTVCPNCGGEAERETNTMPQWAGSSWYFDRYKDPKNPEMLVGETAEQYWGSVDLCIGGLEHATRHLIYARFWHRFLYEIGEVSTAEPFDSVRHVGLVLGSDGRKMGKRYGNVVDPLDIVNKYGADVVRIYSMFMGDFKKETPWDDKGIKGVQKFLNRVWRMPEAIDDSVTESKISGDTVKDIETSIEGLKFNVAVAKLMELSRSVASGGSASKNDIKAFMTLLAPFAPHIVEHIFDKYQLGDISSVQWPDAESMISSKVETQSNGGREYAVMINGKKVDSKLLPNGAVYDGMSYGELSSLFADVGDRLTGKNVQRIIIPQGRGIINIVAK